MASGRRLKHGARVFKFSDGVFLVKQTVLREDRYVIDEHRERHVDPGSCTALGQAVADACAGSLTSGKG